MRIDKKYSTLLFVFLMALMLSMVMSGIMTWRIFGLNEHYIPKWLTSWSFSFVIAFPTAYITVPIVRSFVEKLTK